MSSNPFAADPARRQRYLDLATRIGTPLVQEVARRAAARNADGDADAGSVLPAADVAALIETFGLRDAEELMVLGLDAAKRLARPPISGFFVGAIGLERETGDLVLGGNVEFPGATLAFTLHGEGFVFARAFSRGTSISTLAIGEAHPCAHCRQFIAEFAASRDLLLVDPLGHRLSLSQLYPWPFDPAYLGETGAIAGAVNWPDLSFIAAPRPEIAARLLAAGQHAHAPYGRCPAAVVLELRDGSRFAGSVIESVAFNPGIGPLQAAIVQLLAHGRDPSEIATCWLGSVPDGRVRHDRSTAELLGSIAPAAALNIVGWRA
ncbi:MAG: hypothetical protein P4M09_32055 [Devosia sp.]|nr:hypothetical protein [Devosia sp.]